MCTFPPIRCVALIAGLLVSAVNLPAAGLDSTAAEARELFQKPTRDYSTAPLWVWNDNLTEQQVLETLRDLHSQHVYQAMVHPRPGLATPYMSDQWLRLWKVALDEAERLNMKLWIYDENSYPSGFAGGLVPEAMPDSRQSGLVFYDEKSPSEFTTGTLGVYKLKGGKSEDITERVKAGEKFPAGTYMSIRVEHGPSNAWYANRFYVDLLRREVTEKFLEVTMEPYRKAFGDQFGKRILGVFTDEPNIRARHLAWTPQMYELFKARWGYDLQPHLASLHAPVNDYKRIRYNYFQLLNELFMQNWVKPYYDYCGKHGLEQTGHYWDHEWPNIAGVPDNMAVYAFQQRPAIDMLMNKFAEHTHGQFGNSRMVRELASVTNQMGRTRNLCESFGAGGWDLRAEDVKRIADWLAVLGVNTFNEHFSLITMRGARKRDHPQSFSYHNPWFGEYSRVADYMTRLSVAMSQGRQINTIAVLEPTTSAFLYQDESHPKDALKKLGDDFYHFHQQLERGQVPYDLLSEYVLETTGSIAGDKLRIGQRDYSVLVIPPGTENMTAPTLQMVEEFGKAGGKIINCATSFTLVEGRRSSRLRLVAESGKWEQVPAENIMERLSSEHSDEARVNWIAVPGNGIVFHQRRQLGDADLLFIVNSSLEERARGSWSSSKWNAAERWNLDTGATEPATFERSGNGATGQFDLEPAGSVLLLLKREDKLEPATLASVTSAPLQATEMTARRVKPNVLFIDYVDLKLGDEVTTGLYYHHAAKKAFRTVGLPGSPWERAVQFKDEIISKTFPPASGFEVSYDFTLNDAVPQDLAIVVERPDLYTMTFNDQPVSATQEWWLDKQFFKLQVAKLARVGENRLTLKAGPMTVWHEIEPVFVLGSFAVSNTSRGFELHPDKPLSTGSWRTQGMPFYGWEVAYTRKVTVPEGAAKKYKVRLSDWRGSIARVRVNGQPAGTIAWQPYECDITTALKPGENTIEVEVIGTLKNTVGPHHAGPLRGSAWPANFYAGPETGPPAARKYDFIHYGLFSPFEVVGIN